SSLFLSALPRPPRSPLFPYTTLFRSRIGMRLAAELFAAQPHLVERGRGRAVHVFAHQVEHRPCGEAFQRQQRLRAGPFAHAVDEDRKSTRLNSSHVKISYAVFCLKKK